MTVEMSVVLDVSKLQKLIDELDGNVDQAVATVATEVLSEARARMADAKSGQIYGRRRHQASAPGQAPAIDYGTLTNSGFVRRIKPGWWAVGFGSHYAVYLELGTRRMAPRPFLLPAMVKVTKDLAKSVGKWVFGQ